MNSASSGQPKSILPSSWDVPEEIRQRLGANVGRQRVMESEGHLLLVLHAPPQPEEQVRRGRLFWLQPNGEWRSTEQGAGLPSLQTHVVEYADWVHELDEQVERSKGSQQFFDALNHLAPLLRAARNMHQVLQEARKAKSENRELIDLRDQSYAIERSAELVYGDANNSLQCTVALQAEAQAAASHRMAVSSHRLNVLAAIFFPLATLSALFGVNMIHTLETESAPYPFLVLAGSGLLLGIGLAIYMLRPPGKAGT